MFRSVGRLSLLGRLGGVGKGSLGFVAVPTPTRSIATSVWLAQRENRNEEIDEIFDDDIEGDRRPDHQARGGGGGGGDREFQEAPRRRYRTGYRHFSFFYFLYQRISE
jgi:hypothetical protein